MKKKKVDYIVVIIDGVKERDILQVKLDDAIYNFKRIKNSPRGMVGEDWFKMVANDALNKIDDIKD